jgi:hypothetical protein
MAVIASHGRFSRGVAIPLNRLHPSESRLSKEAALLFIHWLSFNFGETPI